MAALAVLLLYQEVPAPPALDPPKPDSSSLLDPIRGTLRVKYRYRGASSESDTDLYQFLTLSYGNPEKDPVTASLSARLAEDLDGNRKVQGYYPFSSLDDRRRSFATQRLLTAFLDFRPRESGVLLRAGRHVLEDFPEAVAMDGGLVRYQAGSHVALAVFGGVPVNLFESSPRSDAMYGASAEWAPNPERRGRYRLEYLHIRDENVFGLHEDDLLGFSLDEGAGPFNIHARYTLLEGDSRDLVARLTGAVPDAGVLVQLQGTYVFHRIAALSYALDPYASFLMDLQPYVDLAVRASKSFGEFVSFDAAFTFRTLARNGLETTYNHEFMRGEFAPTVRNWPFEAVSLRVSADYWNSSANDFWTISGDLSWALHPDVVLSAGTSYALYSIDAFTGEEHERVRLYSLALKWKVSRKSAFDLRFTLEDNTAGSFRILEAGFRHAF